MENQILTIVTVVLNSANEIEKTLQSVQKLKSARIEYVVLDGGSTDGTVEIIKRYAASIDYWQTQKDGGIYEAMNDSLNYAHGNYILNLNAGDELLSVPFEELEQGMAVCDVFCADICSEHGAKTNARIGKQLCLYNTIPHQACFYKREVFERFRYDTCYRVFADFDLNQRIYKAGLRFQVCRHLVAFHSLQGVSASGKYADEIFRIVKSNYGSLFVFLSWLHFKKEGLKARWKKLHL